MGKGGLQTEILTSKTAVGVIGVFSGLIGKTVLSMKILTTENTEYTER